MASLDWIFTDRADVRVVELDEGTYVVAENRTGDAWYVRGGGPAGDGAYVDKHLSRLARTVLEEHRRHGHIETFATKHDAAASCGASVDEDSIP